MKYLIIDGYNIIHKIRGLEELLDKSLEAARAGLEDLLLSYRSRQRSIQRIYVVYDGKGGLYSESAGKGILHITYSADGQTGDDAMVEIMKKIKDRGRAYVLSADNYVTNHARAMGIRTLSINSFKEKALPRDKPCSPREGADGLGHDEIEAINEELKRKWGI